MTWIMTHLAYLICAAAGAIAALFGIRSVGNVRRKQPKRVAVVKKSKSSAKKTGTMDLILIVLGITLLAFIVAMIVIFCRHGAIPDTLVQCVFALAGGECGVMGMIQRGKQRQQERQWQKEDLKEERKARKEHEGE